MRKHYRRKQMSHPGIDTGAPSPDKQTGEQQRYLRVVREVAPELGAAMLSNAYTHPDDLPSVAVEENDPAEALRLIPAERYLFAD